MRRSTLNFLGVAILVLGLGSVMAIERNVRIQEADRLEDTEATHALLYPQDYGAYMRNAEMMGGKFSVLMDSWWQALENLGRSQAFAITLAIASLSTAAGLFTAASFSRPNR